MLVVGEMPRLRWNCRSRSRVQISPVGNNMQVGARAEGRKRRRATRAVCDLGRNGEANPESCNRDNTVIRSGAVRVGCWPFPVIQPASASMPSSRVGPGRCAVHASVGDGGFEPRRKSICQTGANLAAMLVGNGAVQPRRSQPISITIRPRILPSTIARAMRGAPSASGRGA